jgi:benzoate-CoA ligase family protein
MNDRSPDRFNVCDWLVDRHVRNGGGRRVAFRSADRDVTYDDLLARVERVAAGLARLGVQRETRVLLVMLDSVEFAVTFLGALRIGAIPVPVNPLLPGADLAALADDAGARLAVLSSERFAALEGLAGAALRTIVVTGDNDLPASPSPLLAWDALLAGNDTAPCAATVGDSPGFWLCTSGTTGRPKLAMHRHIDLYLAATAYGAHVLEIGVDDRCYSIAPMFHAYGLGNSLAFPLSIGASAVLVAERPPTPKLVGSVVEHERPTLLFSVPTSYAALLAADLPPSTFASVRRAISAGEALPAEVFERWRERFGMEILDGIGSTEMTHIFISNRAGRAVPGASGVPVPGYDVRLTDADDHDVADDAPGLLWVRGESAALGYWCRAAESRRNFVGEWTRTGDMYTRSSDGVYRYVGRADELFKVAGEWVSPYEVESVLAMHADVIEAAVVGLPNADGVLQCAGFVTVRPDAAIDAPTLLEFCRPYLAGYKRPARVFVVDELPKTATGKIRRVELRQRAADAPVA